MEERLANEIIDAANGVGNAVKKRRYAKDGRPNKHLLIFW